MESSLPHHRGGRYGMSESTAGGSAFADTFHPHRQEPQTSQGLSNTPVENLEPSHGPTISRLEAASQGDGDEIGRYSGHAVGMMARSLGLGEEPNTRSRTEQKALHDCKSRKETCIVNCAITATSWPHLGGKKVQ